MRDILTQISQIYTDESGVFIYLDGASDAPNCG